MIIKSLGRKASGKLTGMGTKGGGPFGRLVDYMTRSDDQEASESVLWHGFYGHAGMSQADIVHEFQANAALLKERKNGNVLYHEILSFSAGYRLRGEALSRAVSDIGQEYLRQRAANQMAFGAIHMDTDHIHLHLMISANEVGKRDRVRLSKKDFADIQKAVEAYTLAHYPELAQTRVYDKARESERLKTEVNEQAMKARTGAQSRKEALKAQLHQLFERAQSPQELEALLRAEGMTPYTRGKNQGVVLRDAKGQERKHRFSTLGLETHYLATVERLAQGRGATPPPPEKEAEAMKPIEVAAKIFEEQKNARPGAAKVVAKEFLTGELHPEWHGDGKDQDQGDNKPYTDSVLQNLERNKERGPSRDQASPGARPPPDRGGDHER
jgi:hypothetical protein